jgi:methyl-accepting chemotaxis protein
MDFGSAIQAHTNWKLRLLSYCRGTMGEKLDVYALQKDNVCPLGQWLHNEAKTLVSGPMLAELVRAHAAFHRCAASVARMVEAGQQAAAEKLLTSRDSEFGKLSMHVVGLLMKLRDATPLPRPEGKVAIARPRPLV